MSNETAYRGYLKKVHAALRDGDASDGERLAKAVSALVRAELARAVVRPAGVEVLPQEQLVEDLHAVAREPGPELLRSIRRPE